MGVELLSGEVTIIDLVVRSVSRSFPVSLSMLLFFFYVYVIY